MDIDTGNALGAKILASWLPSLTGVVEEVTKNTTTDTGMEYIDLGGDIVASAVEDADTCETAVDPAVVAASTSLVFKMKLYAQTAGQTALLGNTANSLGFHLTVNSGAIWWAHENHWGVNNTSGVWLDEETHTACFTYDAVGGVTIWLDDQKIVEDVTATGVASASSVLKFFDRGDGLFNTTKGALYYCHLFPALTDAEYLSIYADPMQVYEAASPTFATTVTATGITGGANLTGLYYFIYDSVDISTASMGDQGTGASTDANGDLVIDVTGMEIPLGAVAVDIRDSANGQVGIDRGAPLVGVAA